MTFRSLMTAAVVACAAGSASATWYVKDESARTVTNELGITFQVFWPSGRPTMSIDKTITLNGQTRVDLSEPCASGCPVINGIGNNAFKDQSTLQEVVFPAKLVSVGADAFRGTSITNLDFSHTVLEMIKGGCCRDLTTLTDVKLSPCLKSIGDWAFGGTTSLTNITPFLPPSMIAVDYDAFNGCAFMGDLKLNCTNMTVVGFRAFENSKITAVDMSGSAITSIGPISRGGDCFKNCTFLTNVVLSSGLQIILGSSFNGCTALKTVTPLLPGGVTNIAAMAFYNVPLEGDLVLTNNAFVRLEGSSFANTRISSARFGDRGDLYVGQYVICAAEKTQNANLTNVVFPAGTVTFDPNKTQWCNRSPNMTALYFRGKPPKNFGGYEVPYNESNKLRIYYPRGDQDWELYLTTNTVKDVSVRSWAPTQQQKNTFASLYPGEKLPKLMMTPRASDFQHFVRTWWPDGAPGLSVIVK